MKRYVCIYVVIIAVWLFGCQRWPNHGGIQDHGYRWYHRAPEYQALCHQSFQLAQMHLFDVRHHPVKHAIVIDLDETVLANGPFIADYMIHRGQTDYAWQEAFSTWIASQQAQLIPGAAGFLTQADHLGFHLFYVTNRQVRYFDATLASLQGLGIPQVSGQTLKMLKKGEYNKVARVEEIRKAGYLVHLLIGDAIDDVALSVAGKPLAQQKQWVNQHPEYFGTRAILLPNPIYGRWLWE